MAKRCGEEGTPGLHPGRPVRVSGDAIKGSPNFKIFSHI